QSLARRAHRRSEEGPQGLDQRVDRRRRGARRARLRRAAAVVLPGSRIARGGVVSRRSEAGGGKNLPPRPRPPSAQSPLAVRTVGKPQGAEEDGGRRMGAPRVPGRVEELGSRDADGGSVNLCQHRLRAAAKRSTRGPQRNRRLLRAPLLLSKSGMGSHGLYEGISIRLVRS